MATPAQAIQARSINTMAEEELLDLAQQGDREAFDELMQRSSSAAMKLAVSILRDVADAEDEVQNSFWKAWISLPQFHRDSRFGTWIHRIVVNQCLMRLRSGRRASLMSLDEPISEDGRVWEPVDVNPNPEQSLGRRELHDVVRKELARLPALLREPLVASALQNQRLTEIASRLNISVPAVKSRLRRAREELRRRMERKQGRLGPATLAV